MMRMRWTAWLLVVALCGCADAVADPTFDPGELMVEESGYLEASLIDLTTTEPANEQTEVELTIVGRPGAAPNKGVVQALNARSDAVVQGDVSAVGSFVVKIDVLQSDQVKLNYLRAADEEVTDQHPEVDVSPPQLHGLPEITHVTVEPPDDHGRVRVFVDLAEPVGDLRFFLVNHTTKAVAELVAHTDLQLVGQIEAEVDQWLLLYAVFGDQETLATEAQVPPRHP